MQTELPERPVETHLERIARIEQRQAAGRQPGLDAALAHDAAAAQLDIDEGRVAGTLGDVGAAPGDRLRARRDARGGSAIGEAGQANFTGERFVPQPLRRQAGEGLAHDLPPIVEGVVASSGGPDTGHRLMRLCHGRVSHGARRTAKPDGSKCTLGQVRHRSSHARARAF